MSPGRWSVALVLALVAPSAGPFGCAPKPAPTRFPSAAPKPALAIAPASLGALEEIPATPPPEPVGKDCLPRANVEDVLEQLRKSIAPTATRADLKLVSAVCKKRVYIVGTARIVVWDAGDHVQAKGSSSPSPRPSLACIDRGLALARELVPFAETILRASAAQAPSLWRDPDVGVVSYLVCDAAAEPDFASIGTMLHEANHWLAPAPCVFEFSAGRPLCFRLDRSLPPGSMAAYPRPPAQLDAHAAAVFTDVQDQYLVHDAQNLPELIDEVMSYRINAELWAAATRTVPGYAASRYNHLPLLLSLVTRYLNELARRDPALAAKHFGPASPNRAALITLFDLAEGSHQTWLRAVHTPGVFERTFWDDYRRGRREWLTKPP